MWSQTYGGESADFIRSLIETSDRGYAIAGWTESYGEGEADFWLVKIDLNGNMQWNETYDAGYYEKAHTLIESSEGGYVIVGYISYSMFSNDFLLIKTDGNGNMQWNQTYGEKGDWNIAYALIKTTDGGYAIVGETLSSNDKVDALLIKTDEQGIIPEFPTGAILPIILTTILIWIIVKSHLKHSTKP